MVRMLAAIKARRGHLLRPMRERWCSPWPGPVEVGSRPGAPWRAERRSSCPSRRRPASGSVSPEDPTRAVMTRFQSVPRRAGGLAHPSDRTGPSCRPCRGQVRPRLTRPVQPAQQPTMARTPLRSPASAPTSLRVPIARACPTGRFRHRPVGAGADSCCGSGPRSPPAAGAGHGPPGDIRWPVRSGAPSRAPDRTNPPRSRRERSG